MNTLTINLPFSNSNSNSQFNRQFSNSQFKSLSSIRGSISSRPAVAVVPPIALKLLSSSSYGFHRISGANSNSKSLSHIRSRISSQLPVAGLDAQPDPLGFDAQPLDPDPPVASFDAQQAVVLPIAVFFDYAPHSDDYEEDRHKNAFHLVRHNRLMLQPQLFLKDHYSTTTTVDVDHQTLLWKEHPNLHRHSFCFVGHGSYLLAGCCDNLVLVCFYDERDVRGERALPREALWNLTTNQLKFLPWRQHRALTDAHVRSYGFGFDHASQDYKVVKFLLYDYDDYTYTNASEYIELYSLKSDSWKEITLKSDIWKEITSRPDGNIRPYSEPSIHINGFYYWEACVEEPSPYKDYFKGKGPISFEDKRAYVDHLVSSKSFNRFSERVEIILSFDFANEKFSNIPQPPYKEGFCYFLVEFDNSLAALLYESYEKRFSFEIWVWGGESWTARVPQLDVPANVVSVVGLFENDKLFLHSAKNELLLFNCATRELENLGIHADPNRLSLWLWD